MRVATFPALPPLGAVLILDGLNHVVDAIAFRADGGDLPKVIIQCVVRLPQTDKEEALDLFRGWGWDVPDEVPLIKSRGSRFEDIK